MAASADIFISHSSEDDAFGRELAKCLHQFFMKNIYKGHELIVWYDSTHIHPGTSWPQSISTALGSCSIFIMIISPASIRSDWVYDEFTIARGHNKKIMPIVWHDPGALVRDYKDNRWTLLSSIQNSNFQQVDLRHIEEADAFKSLCQEISTYLGDELQLRTEANTLSPEKSNIQRMTSILYENFDSQHWDEVIKFSGVMALNYETIIPASVYYMRGVALFNKERYIEADQALALALALSITNDKDLRLDYLHARVEVLRKIGGRWKEIYHLAQEAVSLLPEDKYWLEMERQAEQELVRNPRLSEPPPASIPQSLSTFGTRTLLGHKKSIEDLAWSPNCEFLAAACEDGNVYIWQVNQIEGPSFIYKEHKKHVTAVDWSPSGSLVASVSRDKTVRVWRMGEEKTIARWEHKDWVNDVAWSPNGALLATAGQDQVVRIWNVTMQKQHSKPLHHDDVVRTVAWSADNVHLATGCDNGVISIWNMQTGGMVQAWKDNNTASCIYDMVWLPNGEQEKLAVASADKKVRIWGNVIKGPASYIQLAHQHMVFALASSSDGAYIATTDGTHAQVWDVETQQCIFQNPVHHKRVRALAWASDDMHIASAGEDKQVQVWSFMRDKIGIL